MILQRAGNFLPVISAALIAAIVGFGSTIAVLVQAGSAIGASSDQIISMITALCLGTAIVGAALSYKYKIPLVLAWSTPGAALIAAGAVGIEYRYALGAFCVAAMLMILLGLIPALGRLAARIPATIASAMLAGVLLPFCIALFKSLESDWVLGGSLIAVFILMRQRFPNYALLVVLGVAILIITGRGDIPSGSFEHGDIFGHVSPFMPAFDWKIAISLGVPLFLVTLASQNLPGFVVLRSAGYAPPVQPILFSTGLASLIAAPFGGHGLNLSAMMAAICTGKDAHPDPAQRWQVGMVYAGCYLILALMSAPLVTLFVVMPREAIAAITGIALISPLIGAMGNMFEQNSEHREAAILTFVTTGSGVVIGGIGAAFWGLVMGFTVLAAKRILTR